MCVIVVMRVSIILLIAVLLWTVLIHLFVRIIMMDVITVRIQPMEILSALFVIVLPTDLHIVPLIKRTLL